MTGIKEFDSLADELRKVNHQIKLEKDTLINNLLIRFEKGELSEESMLNELHGIAENEENYHYLVGELIEKTRALEMLNIKIPLMKKEHAYYLYNRRDNFMNYNIFNDAIKFFENIGDFETAEKQKKEKEKVKKLHDRYSKEIEARLEAVK